MLPPHPVTCIKEILQTRPTWQHFISSNWLLRIIWRQSHHAVWFLTDRGLTLCCKFSLISSSAAMLSAQTEMTSSLWEVSVAAGLSATLQLPSNRLLHHSDGESEAAAQISAGSTQEPFRLDSDRLKRILLPGDEFRANLKMKERDGWELQLLSDWTADEWC